MAEKPIGRLDIRIRDQRDKDDLDLVRRDMRRRDNSEVIRDLVRERADAIREKQAKRQPSR